MRNKRDTPLADAVERLDRPRIQALLQRGAQVNAAQADGMTALHWAAHHGDLATAKRLLSAHADVSAANRYGVKPLSLACTTGNTELVELLLQAGADSNTTLLGGESALMTAARTGQVGPVRALLARKANINAKERSGQTALLWAAAEGHTAVVQLLIQAGADFRTPLPSGFTPLFFAVREGHRDVVQVLLRAGIDVKDVMQTQRTGGKAPRKGTSPLLLAVENAHFALAVDLLRAGADPNDQRSGYSALHALTWVRRPNTGDGPDGDPPPLGSGAISDLQFVRELVARGGDVNARLTREDSGRGKLSEIGATPFLFAAHTADLALMRLLVELGADPKIPNADNCPPLVVAAGFGTQAPGEEAGTEDEMMEVLAYLLKLGADINAVDKNGETAMHGAAYKNAPKVVAFLASHGADSKIWNRANKYGWTPQQIAEGNRPGAFKPSPETLAELRRALAPL
ncbi:ankyrin repeat domain-containing protein [Armatimonas sp.]|uniref:ankyrin repeat domain-containing protein n=1 Tax=Armatimonas sp. TaxID=1872638 RepID=UPI0037538507